MRVQDWMTTEVEVAHPEEDVASVRERLRKRHVRQLPVIAAGTLVGIVTDRDVRAEHDPSAKIARVMSPYPMTTTPTTLVEDAAAILAAHKIGALPVIDDGALVGIISDSDLLRALVELTRLLEPTTVVDVECPDGMSEALRARSVLERHGCEVLWMRSATDPQGGAHMTLRVRASRGRAPEQLLEETGFRVSSCLMGNGRGSVGSVA